MDKHSFTTALYNDLMSDYGIRKEFPGVFLSFMDFSAVWSNRDRGLQPYAFTAFVAGEPQQVAINTTFLLFMSELDIEFAIRHELAHVIAPYTKEGHSFEWEEAAAAMGIVPAVNPIIESHVWAFPYLCMPENAVVVGPDLFLR